VGGSDQTTGQVAQSKLCRNRLRQKVRLVKLSFPQFCAMERDGNRGIHTCGYFRIGPHKPDRQPAEHIAKVKPF
jgi:hypothetical protein